VELLVESGGQSWLSQSRDVYDETKSRFCFNDLPGYKIANQITTYNKKCTQYNSSNILSVFQQVSTRPCMCGELHSWHGLFRLVKHHNSLLLISGCLQRAQI